MAWVILLLFTACSPDEHLEERRQQVPETPVSTVPGVPTETPVNDSLDAMAGIIAGTYPAGRMYETLTASEAYQTYAAAFSRRWETFDTSRLRQLTGFRDRVIRSSVKPEKTLFYPFSGPDVLHARMFFPEADTLILLGLEPVGTLPPLAGMEADSLENYFRQLNTSLNAILNFSFFRTESMNKDLKHTEVDGTIHLLLLFLKRTGNDLISARPLIVDSAGEKHYLPSFEALKAGKYKNKGAELCFRSPDGKLRELNYYSLNVVDDALSRNPGFRIYLERMRHFNTYLKGASYLLHKPYFSVMRKVILEGASAVIQDDSGIAYRYFARQPDTWDFELFGEYTRPISMFSNAYQKDLDSLYRRQGSSPLGFGMGYNFKDKNSNLMIAKRK
jgi:hypothetical protein